jgi:hypothetical protein
LMGIEETVVVFNIVITGGGGCGVGDVGIGGVMGILVVSTASAAIIVVICRIVATQSAGHYYSLHA